MIFPKTGLHFGWCTGEPMEPVCSLAVGTAVALFIPAGGWHGSLLERHQDNGRSFSARLAGHLLRGKPDHQITAEDDRERHERAAQEGVRDAPRRDQEPGETA